MATSRIKNFHSGIRGKLAASVSMLCLSLFLGLMLIASASADVGLISKVDTGNTPGGMTNGASDACDVSDEGRFIAFRTLATNIIPGDYNGAYDLYLLDTLNGNVSLISVATDGGFGDDNSGGGCAISADGRYVAFSSAAENLVPGDSNAVDDVFVRDTQLGTTTLVSRNTSGGSADGNSWSPDITPDGRYVVYSSMASNIVAGDGNAVQDVFRADMTAQPNPTVVSPSLDWPVDTAGDSYRPKISDDGKTMTFDSGMDPQGMLDNNGDIDVFWTTLDDQGGIILKKCVSWVNLATANGRSINGDISADGNTVVFNSAADNLSSGDSNGTYDVFKWTYNPSTFHTSLARVSNSTNQNNAANGYSSEASVSDDGRFVAYSSNATDIISGDTNGVFDVYLKDMLTANTQRLSINKSGTQGNGESVEPIISDDGRYVAFDSDAANLILSDGNSIADVFITPVGRHYLFTWYDDYYSDNWVLMSNPDTYVTDAWFNLGIDSANQSLPALSVYAPGQVPPGETITPRYPGLLGGPVDAGSIEGTNAITSQRILWPKGGSSIEETLGLEAGRLSNIFLWTWYDNQSPGYTNWILVANPNASWIYYEITIAGSVVDWGNIQPGGNVAPTFPGVMDGPVSVRAWTDSNKAAPAYVMASQRVLSGYGAAFNEAVGVPVTETYSGHYWWTWYDSVSEGARNWVLIANLETLQNLIYKIDIGGGCDGSGNWNGTPNTACQSGILAPGQIITPEFPGVQNGPVEVTGVRQNNGTPGQFVASQRITFGQSFGETMGYRDTDLSQTYSWTWYDMLTPGMKNWVLVYNPHPYPIDYTIKIGGLEMPGYGPKTIAANSIETPWFPGHMDGPVEVTADDTVLASQRVLYNGFFNEVVGTKLN